MPAESPQHRFGSAGGQAGCSLQLVFRQPPTNTDLIPAGDLTMGYSPGTGTVVGTVEVHAHDDLPDHRFTDRPAGY